MGTRGGSIFRWFIPAIVTLVLLTLVGHTSDGPQIFSRYSVKYFIFLLAMAMVAGALWWVALSAPRYHRFSSRLRQVPLVSSLIAIASLLAMVDVLVPLTKFPFLIALVPLALLMGVTVLPTRSPRESMNTLALLITSVVVGLMIAEGVFRVVFVERRVPHTEAEFVKLISSSWPHPIPVQKDPHTFRILGLADSFGRAGGHENYQYLLESILRDDGLRVEVVNISFPGYEPPDELHVLKRVGARYNPDLVLHGFFVGNDFSVPDGPLAAYRNIPLRPDVGLGMFLPRRFTLVEWLRRYTRVADYRRGVAVAGDHGGASGTFGTDEFSRIERNRMQISRRDGDLNARWQRTVQVLDKIREEVAGLGAEYVMVIHPDQFQVEKGLRHEVAQNFSLNLDRYDFDLPQRFLGKYCTDKRVQCLDLLPAFRAQGSRGGLYLPRNTHYNRRGNTLAAELIYEFVQNRHLLAVGRSPKT